jgi:hypothetical protein
VLAWGVTWQKLGGRSCAWGTAGFLLIRVKRWRFGSWKASVVLCWLVSRFIPILSLVVLEAFLCVLY